MRTFADLAEKLKMRVEDLMQQWNDKAPPSKAQVKGLAKELDIDESFLSRLAMKFRKTLSRPVRNEQSCFCPCKTGFRLAGSPLPGRSRTFWTAAKGFRFYIPSPFPTLTLTQAGLMYGASSTTSM